jgi:hypothetical protein
MHSDVPVFLGFAAVGGKVTLDFPAQARAWTRRLAGESGAEVEMQITLAGQNKTRRQEKGFHAMITPWALERGWNIDDLKQFLLKRIFGTHEFVDPSTGEIYALLAEPRTSQLSRRQYCLLIERSLEIAAEDDFYLTAPDEYRKAKEAAQRQAEREARRQEREAMAHDAPARQ